MFLYNVKLATGETIEVGVADGIDPTDLISVEVIDVETVGVR